MERELVFQLAKVQRRLRQHVCWQRLAIVATLAAVVCLVLWLNPRSMPRHLLQGLVAGGALVILFIWWTSAWHHRSLVGIAQRIEMRFPDLQQRLITAVSRMDRGPTGRLGYLEATVIQEALRHGYRSSWQTIVPARRIWLNRAIVVIGFYLAGTMLWQVDQRPQSFVAYGPSPVALMAPIGAPDVMVLPGDADVERGRPLIITARFSGHVPGDAVLWVRPDGEAARRVPMKRSLDDPLFAIQLSQVERATSYRVEFSGQATDNYRLNVFEYPQLLQADANLKYPSYTRLTDKRITDTRRVSAVEGSELTWIARLNKPVAQAWLESEDGDRLELTREGPDPHAYVLSIPLSQDQRWTLHLEDIQSRHNKDPPDLIARVLRNRPPELKPKVARDLSVSPLQELTVSASVWDDFGISRYGIGYAMAAHPVRDKVLGTDAMAQHEMELSFGLNFESMGAKPDQLLAYHFWAEDVGPDGKSRRTMSDIYFADVRRFDEIFRQGQAPPSGQMPPGQMGPNTQQIQQLIEMQKEIISATWNVQRREPAPRVSERFDADVKIVVESQQQTLQELEKLGSRVSDARSTQFVRQTQDDMGKAVDELRRAILKRSTAPLPDALIAERASYQGLLSLRAREHEVFRRSSSSSTASGGSGGSARQGQLDELELENDTNRYETQQQANRQSEQKGSEREMRQILSRLRDLARRQQDVNKQLRDLQLALQQADTTEGRDEIDRRLKRLRDQQEQLLRDTDEAQQRIDQATNQPQLQQTRRNLEQTRERLQQSAQAVSDGDVPEALSAGTRTEKQFKEMTDDLRKQMAHQFTERMRTLRQSARELEGAQDNIVEKLNEIRGPSAGLRPGDQAGDLQERLSGQKDRVKAFMNDIQETVRDAESSEPLLAQKLYDVYRDAAQGQIEEQLRSSRRLLENGLRDEAAEIVDAAREGIHQLRAGVDDAADAVLGDDVEGLRRAAGTLAELTEELNRELKGAGASDPSAAVSREVAESSGVRSFRESQGTGPISGDDFGSWSDRLRDVEEMVGDAEFRSRAARIRDRARSIRRDMKRRSETPQWNLVREMIATPLEELSQLIAQELARRSGQRDQLVPIDRDPVPRRFDDRVRKYYEQLGQGE